MPIALTGEQQRILAMPLDNPVQIKGVAGSGKTTIAVYRAKHIIAAASDLLRETHVGIFTFNKSLKKYVQGLLESNQLPKGYISINNFHKWAYDFLAEREFWTSHKVVRRQSVESIIADGLSSLSCQHTGRAILGKSVEFYKDEFAWIKGRQISNLDHYRWNMRPDLKGITTR